MENKKKWSLKLSKNIPKLLMKKDRLLILFLLGVLLLVIALPAEKKNSDQGVADSTNRNSGTDAESGQNDYVRYMEQHLEEVLSQMKGVGDVTVMITLKSSAEKVVEKDIEADAESVTESDSQGGTRSTQSSSHGESTVYGEGGDDGQSPYISKELSPQVEGVVVLASGGDSAVAVENITDAVQALFGVDTHKIRIMKKNS